VNDPEKQFTILVDALKATGLDKTLEGAGPFTIFAPTDDAFKALFDKTGMTEQELLADQDVLTKILSYHVVEGKVRLLQLTRGNPLTSLEGESLPVKLDAGVLTLGDATIVSVDHAADNGIVDYLDTVLVPPSVAALLPQATATAEATEAMTATAEATATAERTEAMTATAEATEAATATAQATEAMTATTEATEAATATAQATEAMTATAEATP